MVSCDKHTKSGCKGTKNSLIKILPHNQKLIFSKKTTSRKLKIIFYQKNYQEFIISNFNDLFPKKRTNISLFPFFFDKKQAIYVNLH